MYTLNIIRAIKKMSVNEIRNFIFENYYKCIVFSKESSYSMKHLKRKKDLLLLANKSIEKVPNHCNAKEHYESFLRKKNKKSVTQSEITTYEMKIFEKPSTVDIRSDITEHPKTSHKLYKTIRKGEKVGSNSSLYSNIKKRKISERKKI